jgi:hypothetical protein
MLTTAWNCHLEGIQVASPYKTCASSYCFYSVDQFVRQVRDAGPCRSSRPPALLTNGGKARLDALLPVRPPLPPLFFFCFFLALLSFAHVKTIKEFDANKIQKEARNM